MQSTSIIAQKDQMIYDSFYVYSNPENLKFGSSVMDQHSRIEENSQNFYYKGADKRKQLFSEDNNAEIEIIKNKRDDDQIEFNSNHQIDMFSTRNNFNQYEIKSPISELNTINSPKEKSQIQQSLTEQIGITQDRKISNILRKNQKNQLESNIEEKNSPLQNQQPRKVSQRVHSDSLWQKIRDDHSLQTNNLSINVNASNMLGALSNQNQTIFFPNNNFNNSNGVQNTMQASTYNIHTSPNQASNAVYKHMRKMNHVKQFFQKMCQLSLTYNTRQLKNRHFQLVNDLSYSFLEDQEQIKTSTINWLDNSDKFNIFIALKQLLSYIPIFNPENLWCVLWDILYGISILVYLFFIPMNISFDVEFLPLTYIIIIFQVIHIFISLTRGFYSEGQLILDRKEIVFHYLKQSFIVDIVIIFILYYYHDLLCWTFFINIRKLKRIVERADNYFQIIRKHPTIYEISHLIISILLIGQITGCGFHFIAKKELDSDSHSKTWLIIANVTDQDHWVHKYIASEYFAFITMITVGYGDIYPTTTTERVYVIFMTLCSSAVFGYVMNTIGSIFKQRILKYLDFQSTVEKKNNQTIEVLFKDVPKNLTSEIYQEYFGKILLKNKILSINFSKESLTELSLKIKEKFLQPNEYLIQKGTQEEKVYFLLFGSLEVILETPRRSSVIFQEIKTIGECIGLRNAFNQSEYTYDVKSSENTTTQLFYFEMKDFKEILSKNQRDYEKFCEIKDEITFDSQYLDTKCISCERYNHSVENCPLIHNNISKPNTILRYNHNYLQERTSSKMRKKPNYYCGNLKINCNQIKFLVKQFRFNLSTKHFPEYEQFRDQIMRYDDEKFALELPEFMGKDGSIVLNQDDEEDEDGELRLELNDMLQNLNYPFTQQGVQKNSDTSINSYIEAIQQNNNIPLVHSQLNLQENPLSSIIQPGILLNTPTLLQTPSQIKIASFQNPIFQVENIIDSNVNIQKDSIKELTSKSLISKRDRGDSLSNNFKKAIQSINPPQSGSIQTRAKGIRKLTYKNTLAQQNQEIQLQQEENNQIDHRLFFFQNFEMLKNYTKYFPQGNSDLVIKKYNSIQSQKKVQMLKSYKNTTNTPNHRKKKLVARRSVIPSTFKYMAN